MNDVDAQLLTTAYREVGEMYRTFIGLQKFVWSMCHAANAAIVTGIIYVIVKNHSCSQGICRALLALGIVVSVVAAAQLRGADRIVQRSLRAGRALEKIPGSDNPTLGNWYQDAAGEARIDRSKRIGEPHYALYICGVYTMLYLSAFIGFGLWWPRGAPTGPN